MNIHQPVKRSAVALGGSADELMFALLRFLHAARALSENWLPDVTGIFPLPVNPGRYRAFGRTKVDYPIRADVLD